MRLRSILFMLPLMLAVGCASTSKPAQYGLHETVPVVTKRTIAYATPAGNTTAVTAANELDAAVANMDTIDVADVAAKWPPVKAAYLDYVSKDTRYQPADRLRMGDTVTKIQLLIDNELKRKANLFNFFAPTP